METVKNTGCGDSIEAAEMGLSVSHAQAAELAGLVNSAQLPSTHTGVLPHAAQMGVRVVVYK